MRLFVLITILGSILCTGCDFRPDIGMNPFKGTDTTSKPKSNKDIKKNKVTTTKHTHRHFSNHDSHYPSKQKATTKDHSHHKTSHRKPVQANKIVERKVYTVDEIFVKPHEITSVELRGNKKIRKLPLEIGKLTRLKVLDISGTNISFLPDEIGNCKELRYLIADGCKLKALPQTIGNLILLKQLDLGHNKIREIPSSIGQLQRLRELQLGGNKITYLPESFKQLHNLKFCVLSNNDFVTFPRQVLALNHVEKLWMQGNRFQSIPLEIKNLTDLREFLVDAHEIGTENMNRLYDQMPHVKIIDQEKNKSFF